jgi:purine-binding chemotaxis protein CheW
MSGSQDEIEYVTASVGGQLFGLPISRVQDVFVIERLTHVPLAPPEVAGLINLRGRIVTVIDLRQKLALSSLAEDGPRMALGIERRGESYGLLIDSIGEVLKLPAVGRVDNPINLDARLSRMAAGVHRLDECLLVVVDVDRVLDLSVQAAAA